MLKKIVFTYPLNLYPLAKIIAGETATLIEETEDEYLISLDRHHLGLDRWKNEISLAKNEESYSKNPLFSNYCEFMEN